MVAQELKKANPAVKKVSTFIDKSKVTDAEIRRASS